MSITRRAALVAPAVLPAVGLAASPGVAATPQSRARSAFRYIDFRIRPPFRSFRNTFAEFRNDVPDERMMANLIASMDRANVELGVAMGRFNRRVRVANEDVAALVRTYPGRFAGYGSVDVTNPAKGVDEVKLCADLGLRGIAFDNPDNGLHNDDKSLFPIYEACVRNNLVISINASSFIGPNISFTDPSRIQTVAVQFPQHPVLVTHGAWPYVNEMVALAYMGMVNGGRPNIYFQIDYALMGDKMFPGSQAYIDAINISGVELRGRSPAVYKKAIFGSSYPVITIESAVQRFETLDLTHPDARRCVGRDNALDLLNYRGN